MPDSVGADDESATQLLCALDLEASPTDMRLQSGETPIYSKVRERMMRGAHNITCLDLSSTTIGTQGAFHLASVLRLTVLLKVLNLSGTQIKSEGAESIAEALSGCLVLAELNLHGNRIGPDGVHKLAAELSSCTSLEKLDLSRNIIEDKGSMLLAEKLPEFVSLKDLNLFYNGIGYMGALSFSRILHECPCLCTLNLSNNSLGDTGAVLFTYASKEQCTSLNHLDLSVNNISLTRQECLAKNVARRCPTLCIENLVLRKSTS